MMYPRNDGTEELRWSLTHRPQLRVRFLDYTLHIAKSPNDGHCFVVIYRQANRTEFGSVMGCTDPFHPLCLLQV